MDCNTNGCDGNFAETIELPSKKSITYNAVIIAREDFLQNSFKVGFANCSAEFKNWGFSYFPQAKDVRNPDGSFTWSEDIVLPAAASY